MAPLTKIVALFEKKCRGAFLALFGEKVAHLNSKHLNTLSVAPNATTFGLGHFQHYFIIVLEEPNVIRRSHHADEV